MESKRIAKGHEMVLAAAHDILQYYKEEKEASPYFVLYKKKDKNFCEYALLPRDSKKYQVTDKAIKKYELKDLLSDIDHNNEALCICHLTEFMLTVLAAAEEEEAASSMSEARREATREQELQARERAVEEKAQAIRGAILTLIEEDHRRIDRDMAICRNPRLNPGRYQEIKAKYGPPKSLFDFFEHAGSSGYYDDFDRDCGIA